MEAFFVWRYINTPKGIFMLPNYVTTVNLKGHLCNVVIFVQIGEVAVYLEYDQLLSDDKIMLDSLIEEANVSLPLQHPEHFTQYFGSRDCLQGRHLRAFLQTTFDGFQ